MAGYLPLHGNTSAVISQPGTDREDMIGNYFGLGFKYREILLFLEEYHGIGLSVRQLHRILRGMGLKRRGNTNYVPVIETITDELNNCGGSLGYRAMHARLLKKHNLHTNRETVRIILRELDPEGVAFRQSRRLRRRIYHVEGPNALWHIDGWDKLKKFGLAVHGAIDGFSRRILWLAVGPTNNNPSVVGKYFVQTVKQLSILPAVNRADRGTENVNIELIQTLLSDPIRPSFLYGKSTHNQRIECWWSKFKLLGMNAWVERLESIADVGIIDTSNRLHIQCVRFCFLDILRQEMAEIMKEWNTHVIRASRPHHTYGGRPDVMYYLPELFGKHNCGKTYEAEDLNLLEQEFTYEVPDCEEPFAELFLMTLLESGQTKPQTISDAEKMLVNLLDQIENELESV